MNTFTTSGEVGGGQVPQEKVNLHICTVTHCLDHLMVTYTELAQDTKVCVWNFTTSKNVKKTAFSLFYSYFLSEFFSLISNPHTVLLELSRFSSHRDLTRSEPVRASRRRRRDSHREIQSTISPRRLGSGCVRCHVPGAVSHHHHHHCRHPHHEPPVVHSSAFHY